MSAGEGQAPPFSLPARGSSRYRFPASASLSVPVAALPRHFPPPFHARCLLRVPVSLLSEAVWWDLRFLASRGEITSCSGLVLVGLQSLLYFPRPGPVHCIWGQVGTEWTAAPALRKNGRRAGFPGSRNRSSKLVLRRPWCSSRGSFKTKGIVKSGSRHCKCNIFTLLSCFEFRHVREWAVVRNLFSFATLYRLG